MKFVFTVWLAIFITLKLVHVVAWSWLLVLLPLWIYLGFWMLVFLIAVIIKVLEDV